MEHGKHEMDSAILRHHQNVLHQKKRLISSDHEGSLVVNSKDSATSLSRSDKETLQEILKDKALLQEEIDKTFGDGSEDITLLSFGPRLNKEKSLSVDHLLGERQREFTEMQQKSLANRRELEKQKERLDAETQWLKSLSGQQSDGEQDFRSFVQSLNYGLPDQEEIYKILFEKQNRENDRLKRIVVDAADAMSHEPLRSYNLYKSPELQPRDHTNRQRSPSFLSYGGIAQLLMEEIVLEETYQQVEQICNEALGLWQFIKFKTSSGLVRTVEAFVTDNPEGRPLDDPLHILNAKYFHQLQTDRQLHRQKIWTHTQPVTFDDTSDSTRDDDKDDTDTIVLNFYNITPSYLHLQKVRRKDSVDVKLHKERYHRLKQTEVSYWSGYKAEITKIPIPKKFQGISLARFSPNDKFLAVSSGHGDLIVFDTSWEPWREYRVLANRGKKNDPVVDLHWSMDGTKLLVINKMGILTLWSLTASESGKEDADLLAIKEDVAGIVPGQLVPLIMLDADQNDFTFRNGPLRDEQNMEKKISPLVATFDSTFTTFGAQNNICVGLSNGDIICCETERAAYSVNHENFERTTVINGPDLLTQDEISPESEIGQNISAQLFRQHKSPLVLIDVIGGTEDLVSVDARGCVMLWKRRIKEKTAQGSYRPHKKYRVDFTKKVYVPAEDAKSNVIFSARNLASQGKSQHQIAVERQRAVSLIEDMKLSDPWHDEVLPEVNLVREIHKPDGNISSAGAIFHVLEKQESPPALQSYFTRLFKPVQVNCLKFLCCVMSPTKKEIVFVLLFPQYEPKEAHITVIILDLSKMSLRNVRVDIRIKEPEIYMNQNVVSCDISRTLGATGAPYIFLNIKGTFYGISMATGQFILRTENPATPINDFQGLRLNSQLLNIMPESEVAAANINGSLTLLSYTSGQRKSKDQRNMTVIKLKDENTDQDRTVMKGRHNLYFSSQSLPSRELRLEKLIYEQQDYIWADVYALTLNIMDKALLTAKVISQNDLEKFEKNYFMKAYYDAANQIVKLGNADA